MHAYIVPYTHTRTHTPMRVAHARFPHREISRQAACGSCPFLSRAYEFHVRTLYKGRKSAASCVYKLLLQREKKEGQIKGRYLPRRLLYFSTSVGRISQQQQAGMSKRGVANSIPAVRRNYCIHGRVCIYRYCQIKVSLLID